MKSDSSAFDVFIDSDVFVALWLIEDPLRERALSLMQHIGQQKLMVVTSNLVTSETATVLSHKHGMDAATAFLRSVRELQTVFLSQELHRQAQQLFEQQTKRGTSFVDCANVITIRHYEIDAIASFDKAYPLQYGVPLLQ